MNKNYKDKGSLHARVRKGEVQIQDQFDRTPVRPHVLRTRMCQASKNLLSILLDLSV